MNAEFNSIDRAIIAHLQNDARITNRELAARVNLSPSACLARVRSLRERGVLTSFRAEVDLPSIGRPLQALIAIRMMSHRRPDLDRLVADLIALPETLSLFHISGADDYLLHIAVPDTDVLRDFVLDRLTSRPEIAQVQTSIVFEHMRSASVAVLPGAEGITER
jgi:DNA-binding Lrp family transcriptional regulator